MSCFINMEIIVDTNVVKADSNMGRVDESRVGVGQGNHNFGVSLEESSINRSLASAVGKRLSLNRPLLRYHHNPKSSSHSIGWLVGLNLNGDDMYIVYVGYDYECFS